MMEAPADDGELAPLSMLLLGIAAIGAVIDASVSDDGDSPRVPEQCPALELLLGAIALREELARAVPPAPEPAVAPMTERVPLRRLLR